MQTKAGQWHWVLVRGKVILRNNDGKPLRALGTQTDIQSKKNAEIELKESRDRVRSLSHQLIKNSEEEKKHLAQELHDEFGQLLTVLQLGVEITYNGYLTKQSALNSQCVRLLDTIKRMEKELRRICDNLRPDILDDLGLDAALEWLVTQFSAFNEIQVRLNSEVSETRLSPEKELVLYRICQESLNNVSKHASATDVTVDLEECADKITLTIRDNGRGFNPAQTDIKKRHWGMGLLGMNERAAVLSGDVTIESESGKGTTILATLPKTTIEGDS
jgi:two-component system sensor histidine kinase UhpB